MTKTNPNGDIELRSTDFEALQEEKQRRLLFRMKDCKPKREGVYGYNLVQQYKVKESWTEVQKYIPDHDAHGDVIGDHSQLLEKAEHVIILQKI